MRRSQWYYAGFPQESIPQIPPSVGDEPYAVERWLISVMRHACDVELAIAPEQQTTWNDENHFRWNATGGYLTLILRCPVEVKGIVLEPYVSLSS
jgi:hypothetical protein